MVDAFTSTQARRVACADNTARDKRKRRGRPPAMDSQAAKRARRHTGSLGFQPAKHASKDAEPSTGEQSATEEPPSIGVALPALVSPCLA